MNKKLYKLALSIFIVVSLVLAPFQGITVAAAKKVLATSVTITNPSYSTYTIAKGSSKKLSVSIAPTKVSNTKLKWKSSDTSIVTVSSKGVITGIKNGTAKVTAATTDGSDKQTSITVTVGTPVTKITAKTTKVTLTEGKTSTIKTTITPSKASNKEVVYTTSNKKVATVTKSGKITAVSSGQATITIAAKDGSGKAAKVKVVVEGKKVIKTLTNADVVNGIISLSNVTYDKLTIDSSVGDAIINLNKVVIKDALEMGANAKYVVKAKDSDINRVVALEEKENIITAFSNEEVALDAPTFIAEKGTLVVTIDARGNVSVKQEGKATIGTITVNRKSDGKIDLNIEGFNGNLVVNTTSNANIAISTKSCNIGEATIGGTSSGQKLTLTDNSTQGNTSNIGKINIETNAKVNIDVKATELTIAKTVTNASVTVEKPIETVTNEGKSSKLTINSNVNNVISAGDSLDIKVTAGSTVKSIEASGDSSKIEVALGSTIQNVVSKGNNAEIKGNGKVNEVKVEGNDTKVNTSNTSVSVSENATGTTANGESVSGGATITAVPTPVPPTVPTTPTSSPTVPTSTPTVPTSTPTSAPTGTPTIAPTGTPTIAPTDTPTGTPTIAPTIAPSGTPTVKPTTTPTGTPIATPTPSNPETGTKIEISDPGEVWAGTLVEFRAEYDDVSWSVYPNIGGTGGYATINSTTGELNPISLGTVRVVATSLSNEKVYGAVDVTILGKKFVGYEPLETIIIDSDESIMYINQLKDSGKLPTHVNLIYETGKGNETETIKGELYDSSWYGTFKGTEVGKHLVECYVNVPSGYQRPSDFYANVVVDIQVPQSDLTKEVTGYKPLEPITITEDLQAVKITDFFNIFRDQINIQVEAGEEILNIKNFGYSVSSANQFNGAALGTYVVDLSVQLPTNYIRTVERVGDNYALWNTETYISIPLTVVIDTVQTSKEIIKPIIPDTTQPKFIQVIKTANIETVTLTDVPETFNAGDDIDFSQYLSIVTDSNLESDNRVIWSYNDSIYAENVDSIGGKVIFKYEGIQTIKATSVVDNTKSASIKVNAVNNKEVVECNSFDSINVSEDIKLYNFKTVYKYLKGQLPTIITGKGINGEDVILSISGWYLDESSETFMTIAPNIRHLNGYHINYRMRPKITINFSVPQTEDTKKVDSVELINTNVTLSEDKYATSEMFLLNAIYDYDSSYTYVRIKAKLEDGTIEEITGKFNEYYYFDLYKGRVGEYDFTLFITLPDGYSSNQPTDSSYFKVPLTVNVMVDQTNRYEKLWVEKEPKLIYNVGDTLDLSDMLVSVKDTIQIEDTSVINISYDKFAEYGLELRAGQPYGRVITTEEQLTMELNNYYIYVYNTKNDESTFFGPLTIIE